jgi:hypothetical protein
MQRYLVIDDLSTNLNIHPIYIPIPIELFELQQTDKDTIYERLVAFTKKVYEDFIRLGYFEFFHSHNNDDDIVINDFSIRFDKVYPNVST